MRNLTITRNKTFVGCLVKVKFYIEDPQSGDLTIRGIACRKLGELKNGQSATFAIEEGAARIFAIADTTSKDYCCDFYQLAEGQENICLSGQPRFNLAIGNAFLFDGNDNPEAKEFRKKGKGKGVLVLILAAVIGLGIGLLVNGGLDSIFDANLQKPKTFTYQDMSITLTNQFRETEFEGFDVCYDSSRAAVFVLHEPFALAEGFEDYTLEEYAQLVIDVNELDDTQVRIRDGHTYFEYDAVVDNGTTYRYHAFAFKTDKAFWLVQIAVSADQATKEEDAIWSWANSVTFE